jgi:SAM-dependent methyltransferase
LDLKLKMKQKVVIDKLKDYWHRRKNSVYLHYVDYITCALGEKSKSVIDVGSRHCQYLDWFPWFRERVSLDLDDPYVGTGVESITADFLKWEPGRSFDVVLCLQVLEHVPKVHEFAAKLMKTGRHVIVSVPYKWAPGSVRSHVHDPIDRAKFESWFPQKPDYFVIAREPLSRRNGQRIVAYFDAEAPGSGSIFRKRGTARRVMVAREKDKVTSARGL